MISMMADLILEQQVHRQNAIYSESRKLTSVNSSDCVYGRMTANQQIHRFFSNKSTFDFFQIWMSVRTTTMGDVSMNASTFQATTGAPATMDSCWPMMDTTVWVRPLCLTQIDI